MTKDPNCYGKTNTKIIKLTTFFIHYEVFLQPSLNKQFFNQAFYSPFRDINKYILQIAKFKTALERVFPLKG